MAKTVGFGKLEREMLSNDRLPPDVRMAIVGFKNDIKTNRDLIPYENRDGGLPLAAAGQAYYEHQVGQAHQGDPRPRGKATGRSYFTCDSVSLGLMTMSYFGNVAERCSRASYGFISLAATRTPSG